MILLFNYACKYRIKRVKVLSRDMARWILVTSVILAFLLVRYIFLRVGWSLAIIEPTDVRMAVASTPAAEREALPTVFSNLFNLAAI